MAKKIKKFQPNSKLSQVISSLYDAIILETSEIVGYAITDEEISNEDGVAICQNILQLLLQIFFDLGVPASVVEIWAANFDDTTSNPAWEKKKRIELLPELITNSTFPQTRMQQSVKNISETYHTVMSETFPELLHHIGTVYTHPSEEIFTYLFANCSIAARSYRLSQEYLKDCCLKTVD